MFANLEEVIKSEEAPAYLKLYLLNNKGSGTYLKPSHFYKSLQGNDLEALSAICEEMYEKNPKDSSVKVVMLLGIILAQLEGVELQDAEQVHTAMQTTVLLTALEKLKRTNCIDVEYDAFTYDTSVETPIAKLSETYKNSLKDKE